MIQGFAFDLDETLVDCEEQHVEATRAMLEALGEPTSAARDIFEGTGTTGMSTPLLIEMLRDGLRLPRSTDELLALRHTAFLAELDADPAQPQPGALALLEACHARGPIALVTNGHREDAIASARSAGILRYFATVVTAEDVLHPKPHPEPYKTAASRLSLPPGDILVFEDSARGVAAAIEAGCRVVAVPHPRSTKPDAVALAHVVLGSLEEALPLDALLARLA